MTKYLVTIEASVTRFLERLPADIRNQFSRRIEELKEGKQGHKRLSEHHPYELWEIKVSGYRLYYVTYHHLLFISQIAYDGTSHVYAIGNKNDQPQSIRFGLSYINKRQKINFNK